MKKTLALIPFACVLAMPLSALAGDDVAKMLNLKGDRADQVEDIMENYHDQREAIKDRAHDDMKALKEQKMSSLKTVLSDDEYNKLEDMYEAKKSAHEKHKDMNKDCKEWMDDGYDD